MFLSDKPYSACRIKILQTMYAWMKKAFFTGILMAFYALSICEYAKYSPISSSFLRLRQHGAQKFLR